VDVHCPCGEYTTDEDDEEPDCPDSDSSDGMTLWYLNEDASQGTPVTFGARCGAASKSVVSGDNDVEEVDEELEEVGSESDAPTELMALDP